MKRSMKQIGKKIPGFSQAQAFYKFLPGVDKKLLDKYWSGDIAKGAFNTKTGLFSKKFWTSPSKNTDASCNKVVYDKKTGKYPQHVLLGGVSATELLPKGCGVYPTIFLTHIYRNGFCNKIQAG